MLMAVHVLATTSGSVEQAIFDVARLLEVPVLVAALGALALVLVEVGRCAAEVRRRRRRNVNALDDALLDAERALATGDLDGASASLAPIAWSRTMGATLDAVVTAEGTSGRDDRRAKALADFDYASLRRLERTRILVRVGPALGLMGTLIPLSPALEALANGDVDKLARDLRVAFSVTILGLLIGGIAFGVSLVRDRLYAHDLSDLEYVVARLNAAGDAASLPGNAHEARR